MKASHSKTSKHKPINVKLEKVEGKQVQTPCQEEHDLTYYVKDRVELMKQIFSILKDRELLAMAPDCLRDMKLDELQEALLDEVYFWFVCVQYVILIHIYSYIHVI